MAKVKVESAPEVSGGFSGEALTGLDIYWYKGAGVGVDPRPAKVVRGYSGGACDMIVFNGDSTYSYLSVYHKSNPALLENGVPTDNARRNGCWGFTPWSNDIQVMYGK